MGKLIYSLSTSLDGYAADKHGNFDWGQPSEDEHAYINFVLEGVGTFLLGRKMCETMAVWDTMALTGASPVIRDFAKIWRAADKVMYSKERLESPVQGARVENRFDVEAVRKLKLSSKKDLGIGGPHLAADAIRAGLVDEFHQYVVPIIIGGGNKWLPTDARLSLRLVDVRKFSNGFVHLQYEAV